MNAQQKKHTIIAAILLAFAILIPICCLLCSGTIASWIFGPSLDDLDPNEAAIPGVAAFLMIFAYLAIGAVAPLIALGIGSVFTLILSYLAHRTLSKLFVSLPEGEAAPLFPRILRVIKNILIVISALFLLACLGFIMLISILSA